MYGGLYNIMLGSTSHNLNCLNRVEILVMRLIILSEQDKSTVYIVNQVLHIPFWLPYTWTMLLHVYRISLLMYDLISLTAFRLIWLSYVFKIFRTGAVNKNITPFLFDIRQYRIIYLHKLSRTKKWKKVKKQNVHEIV